MPVPALNKMLEQIQGMPLGPQSFADAGAQIELLAQEELDKARAAREDIEIATLVQRFYSDAKNARATYESRWYKNIDMYLGRQFTYWDSGQRSMVERPSPDYENRMCINIIEPIVRTESAKTSSVHPRASVLPASNDETDLRAAKAAEAIWDWHYESSEYHSGTYAVANFWRGQTGMGFGKMFYDQTAIDTQATEARMREFREQQRRLGPDAGLVEKPEPVRGCITSSPVTPFHFFVGDLTETTIQRQPWVMHAFVMPVEKAKMVYASHVEKRGRKWEPATVSANEIVNLSHLDIHSSSGSATDFVLVQELYIKEGAHELFPKGGMAVVAGGVLVGVARKGIPYEHGEYPFEALVGIETGSFYRKSVIESITPIQDDLNRFYNALAQQRDLLGKPMFYYDEGSFDPRRVRSKPGTHIPIRLGMRDPRPVQIVEPPSFAFNFVDRLMVHRDDISGQHQVSRATSPGADTAASALALLKETDDDYLSTTFDSIQQFTRTMARQYLALAIQFWDEPRMVKIAGVDQSLNVSAFIGSDIAGGTDVRIDGESVLPKSKAAKSAQITEWIDKGIIPPETGLEVLEMGNLGKVYDRIRRDKDAAAAEHTKLMNMTAEEIQQMQQQHQAQIEQMSAQVEQATGAAPDPSLVPPLEILPIHWYDNDAVHFEEHRLFANSAAYQILSPEQQQALDQHAQAHLERMQAMAMPAEDPAAEDAAGYDESAAPSAAA